MLHRHEKIAEAAYYIYLKRGAPAGQDLEHWLAAEHELKEEVVLVDAVHREESEGGIVEEETEKTKSFAIN